MKTKEGLWKISPSSLYGYDECPACFWVERHIGRAPSIPMRLNSAVDESLKSRYDMYRAKNELPPELSELKDVTLFKDLKVLDVWRQNFKGLEYENKKDGYILKGALDEVLVASDGKHIPVDFKSSGDVPKEDKQKYYIFQLHAYSLMLRENGYPPADIAYLVHYFTKDKKDTSLLMEFESHFDRVLINLFSFEGKMREIAAFLNNNFPGASQKCAKCVWCEKRNAL